ncbi:MAG: sn-glycerol-3-phosphate ABC transporter ATP-binding protein UgpC [Alphaproteobacteria bacterium]
MAAVTLTGVHKYYGDVHAVRGIDLAIDEDEFAVLVGPSGCGKSTLLRMVAGLESVDEGTVRIDGAIVNDMRPRDRDIAMVFQNYALYPYLRVFENIAFGLRARKVPAAEIGERVAAVARMLDIATLLDRKPRQLSGGQRQRVAMGRAVVRNARLFLFDEPLSNLDAQLRDEMRIEIKRLHNEIRTTTIYVTHDQIEAMTLADRIVLLRDGRVEQQGTPLELFERPATYFVAAFLGSPRMNFLPGRLVESDAGLGVALDGGDGDPQVLALPAGRRAELAGRAGRPVLLGLRPEHMTRAREGEARPGVITVPIVVELVEPTGSRTYVTAHLGDTSVLAELAPHDVTGPGQRIDLDADMNRAVVIDPETERVL